MTCCHPKKVTIPCVVSWRFPGFNVWPILTLVILGCRKPLRCVLRFDGQERLVWLQIVGTNKWWNWYYNRKEQSIFWSCWCRIFSPTWPYIKYHPRNHVLVLGVIHVGHVKGIWHRPWRASGHMLRSALNGLCVASRACPSQLLRDALFVDSCKAIPGTKHVFCFRLIDHLLLLGRHPKVIELV